MIRLDTIQSNIVKPHGRDYSLYYFLVLKNNRTEQLKTWISSLSNHVSTAKDQANQSTAYREYGIDDSTLISVHFSRSGVEKIGNNPLKEGIDFPQMSDESARYRLNDPSVTQLELFYQTPIDALLCFSGDQMPRILEKYYEIRILTEKYDIIGTYHTEFGSVIRNDNGNKIEHFGFRDDITQIKFLKSDGSPDEPKLRDVVFLSEKESDDHLGSFFVFRKLEQNVLRFNTQIESLSKKLKIQPELVEAQIVGRFKNGIPLTITAKSDSENLTFEERTLISDFDNRKSDNFETGGYQADPYGYKCPFHAHIRKANPRNIDVLENYNNTKMPITIVRRSIPYGILNSQSEKGMLFGCFVKDIMNQFVSIQMRWCSQEFPGDPNPFNTSEKSKKDGWDGLIGQPKMDQISIKGQVFYQEWNKRTSKRIRFSIKDCVTFKGGEFFYTPSIPFLKSLSSE